MRNLSKRRVIASSVVSILPILASFAAVVLLPIPRQLQPIFIVFAGLARGLILIYLLDPNRKADEI